MNNNEQCNTANCYLKETHYQQHYASLYPHIKLE